MLSNTDVQPYIDRLADKIQKVTEDTTVVEAFRNVPRHIFVQNGFYIYEVQNRRMQFISLDNTEVSTWLDIIYDNQVLMLSHTNDDYRSSSSEPILMAQMLSALQIDIGMNILEIGTGSGYNAALLAYLVGSTGKVTTIDLEPKLTKDAQKIFSEVSKDIVSVHTGNGLLGVAQNAPYDRIIATASHNRVPYDWIEQLQDGGILLMSFTQTGGMLILKKQGLSATGQFLEQRGYFMPMITERPDNTEILIKISDLNTLLSEDFRFFAGWLIPDVSIFSVNSVEDDKKSGQLAIRFRSRHKNESVIIKTTDNQTKLFKQSSEEFAKVIIDVIDKWETFGHPSSSQLIYQVDLSENLQVIRTDDKELARLDG